MSGEEESEPVESLLATPHLADALESDQFKQFLDQMPLAIAVAELSPSERIVYANKEFERLTGLAASGIVGRPWEVLPGADDAKRALPEAVAQDSDYIGEFTITRDGAEASVDAWSNIIEDDASRPTYRLLALVERQRTETPSEELRKQVQEKDTLLRELQHRVKNNLQMITALIRVEARGMAQDGLGAGFDRLAGRVEALGLLYRALTEGDASDSIDLGVYLSQIASAVMRAHAVEGIHLDLQVDTWPVSVDVAMPAGLVVNEVLTNALKHAFEGRSGGRITLHSIAGARGCTVTIADDGVGLPEGSVWPKPGKLSALIVQSLRQNARASIEVTSSPGQGMKVVIQFTRSDAAPVS